MFNIGTYPQISIILPTYNRAEYIIETIESIRKQTYTDWELLVVDDCSTDKTAELIGQINDSRIQLLKTAKRVGIAETRSKGVQHAKGELIAFMDSDDLWDSSKLAKQVTAMIEYSEAGFCLTGGYNFRKMGEPVAFFYKQTEGLKYDTLLISFFKSEVAATTPSLMFRKKCLELTGFSDHVDFILRLASHYKGIILYESLLFRRLHDSNISNEKWERRHEEGIQILRSYADKVPSEIARDALFKSYINGGEKYLLFHKNKKAIQKFLSAWQYKPFSIVPVKKIAKAVLYFFKK